jgi:chemotaxis protein MotB
MIKKLALLLIITVSLTACVSKKVYTELETKYNKLRSANTALIEEKDNLLVAKKSLEDDLLELTKQFDALEVEKNTLQNEMSALQNKYANLEESYQALSEQSTKKLTEQAQKNQELLAKLEEKEGILATESVRLTNLQKELNQRSAQIEELQRLIQSKEKEMEQLKTAISNALLNFEGKGLTVEYKNGKIYVSMENKLLFNSGSWAVGNEGKKAVEQLASVLSENTDINVLIEGHTDDVPYNGNTVLDNWDLSVKRATAIVRILEEKGVNPTQITAAGRSEYVPVSSNETSEGKAKNRRIEIILAPNLDEISKLLTAE